MKKLSLILFVTLLLSCQENTIKRKNNNETFYKPGFGELMGGIQNHHAKLWFAFQNDNWKLAQFEIKELTEIFSDITVFQKDRKETKSIKMITPSLNLVAESIQQKDTILFIKAYSSLTKACNDCHKTTSYEYIIIKTPDLSPFYNQAFKLPK